MHVRCGVHACNWLAQYRPVVANLYEAQAVTTSRTLNRLPSASVLPSGCSAPPMASRTRPTARPSRSLDPSTTTSGDGSSVDESTVVRRPAGPRARRSAHASRACRQCRGGAAAQQSDRRSA